MKRRIGIQGSLLFLSAVASVLFFKHLFPRWANLSADRFFDGIGIFLVLAGFLLRISARGHKALNSDNGKRLVTDGPYALVRNPMYFGTLLIGTGTIAVLFAWWVLFLFLAVFLMIYVPQISAEEKYLAGAFGDAYKEYSLKVPGYFPGPGACFSRDLRERLLFRPGWIRRELPSLLGAFVAIMLAEVAEDIHLFGRRAGMQEALLLLGAAIAVISLFYLFFCKRAPADA